MRKQHKQLDVKSKKSKPVEAAKAVKYEKPTLNLSTLEDMAKAFAPRSGMGSC